MLSNQKSGWLNSPTHDHLVQYYPYDKALLDSLQEYVGSGLEKNETCIAVITRQHADKLDERLKNRGIDVDKAKLNGSYRILDADSTLAALLNQNENLETVNFSKSIEFMMKEAIDAGRPVRVFGEMVSLLWKNNNLEAVLQLEKLWNDLSDRYGYSLFCAYPQIHFDRDIHRDSLDEINRCHSLVTPAF